MIRRERERWVRRMHLHKKTSMRNRAEPTHANSPLRTRIKKRRDHRLTDSVITPSLLGTSLVSCSICAKPRRPYENTGGPTVKLHSFHSLYHSLLSLPLEIAPVRVDFSHHSNHHFLYVFPRCSSLSANVHSALRKPSILYNKHETWNPRNQSRSADNDPRETPLILKRRHVAKIFFSREHTRSSNLEIRLAEQARVTETGDKKTSTGTLGSHHFHTANAPIELLKLHHTQIARFSEEKGNSVSVSSLKLLHIPLHSCFKIDQRKHVVLNRNKNPLH